MLLARETAFREMLFGPQMLLAREKAFREMLFGPRDGIPPYGFAAMLFSPPNVSGCGSSFSPQIKLQSAARFPVARKAWRLAGPGAAAGGPRDNGGSAG